MECKDMEKTEYFRLLDDLACDTCKDGYCFFKRLLRSLHPEPRILIQIKCVEKFKWELGVRGGEEISESQAWEKWVDNGYAEVFAEIYDEHMYFKDIYRKILEKVEHREIPQEL